MPAASRVVIADDHSGYRRGLARAIDRVAELELVGEAGDGRAALSLVLEMSPDIVVLDVRMSGLDGLEVARQLRDRSAAEVVLITGSSVAELEPAAREAGVRHVLSKELSRHEICARLLSLR